MYYRYVLSIIISKIYSFSDLLRVITIHCSPGGWFLVGIKRLPTPSVFGIGFCSMKLKKSCIAITSYSILNLDKIKGAMNVYGWSYRNINLFYFSGWNTIRGISLMNLTSSSVSSSPSSSLNSKESNVEETSCWVYLIPHIPSR